MAVEKAPYINYTEITSYMEDIDNGSEIPVFIIKTNNSVSVADITSDKVKKFVSYGAFTDNENGFSIPYNEDEYELLNASLKEADKIIKDFFIENSMYGSNDSYGLSVPFIYVVDVGNAPTIAHYKKALQVSESKRKSTVAVFPSTEDVEFMKEVKTKLMEETKSGLLRIGYFGVSGQGKLTSKFAKGDVLKPTFDHHGYVDIVEGYAKIVSDEVEGFYTNYADSNYTDAITPSANYVYKDKISGKYYTYANSSFTETTLATLTGYSKVIEGYKHDNKFYEDDAHQTEITPLTETAIYLDKGNSSSIDAYTVKGTSFVKINVQVNKSVLLYESDEDYKFFIPSTKKEMGGTSESFEEYCKRLEFISNEVQSSRVAIVEKEYFGKTIARICSTPYYIEPGYLPYMSVATGVFEERTTEQRDSLFGTGLIFNEDDYTLNNALSRICLATSTAWGISDHDLRTTDALIHARRNVDYHIRKIMSIIAPQLKRNETSVTLRYVQNQIDTYLDSELTKGTIMEYSVKITESSYNPYALLIQGKITPVNSTLAIEFENTVGSPYAIASDYV